VGLLDTATIYCVECDRVSWHLAFFRIVMRRKKVQQPPKGGDEAWANVHEGSPSAFGVIHVTGDLFEVIADVRLDVK